jgi:hypothetical protein
LSDLVQPKWKTDFARLAGSKLQHRTAVSPCYSAAVYTPPHPTYEGTRQHSSGPKAARHFLAARTANGRASAHSECLDIFPKLPPYPNRTFAQPIVNPHSKIKFLFFFKYTRRQLAQLLSHPHPQNVPSRAHFECVTSFSESAVVVVVFFNLLKALGSSSGDCVGRVRSGTSGDGDRVGSAGCRLVDR